MEQLQKKLMEVFDMRPYAIETRFNLRTPIYSETAAYGHMGRTQKWLTKPLLPNGEKKKAWM